MLRASCFISVKAPLISNLIRMAIDVYNDSMIKTLSACSWPSRCLAQQHAEKQVSQYRDNGLDCPFTPFEPSDGSLRYKNPTYYSEMLNVVSSLEQERVTTFLKQADCFSLQVDKSVDKYNVESLFITARYFDREYELKVAFLGEAHSELRGAEGMLKAMSDMFISQGLMQVLQDNLVSLTTDGEAANTGSKTGLWKRLKDKLGRGFLTFWCVAHRSDLALKNLKQLQSTDTGKPILLA